MLKEEVKKFQRSLLGNTSPRSGSEVSLPTRRNSNEGSAAGHSRQSSIESTGSLQNMASALGRIPMNRPDILIAGSSIGPRVSTTLGSPSNSSRPPLSPTFSEISPTHPLDLQYLKAVVIKFIEKRDTRAHLLPVIATLLKCSPDESKRIIGARI